MIIINVSAGRHTDTVATTEPQNPATVYPTYVAELMAMGPGVICETATMSANSALDIQPFCTTTSFCMSESMAYPPPKPKNPIFR